MYITTEFHGRMQGGNFSSPKHLVYDHICISFHALI